MSAATPVDGTAFLALVNRKTWSSQEVAAAARFAATRMGEYECSHSFDHALRVHGIACRIAHEHVPSPCIVDVTLVELGALLHDVFDHKVTASAQKVMLESERGLTTAQLLEKHLTETIGVTCPETIDRVVRIAEGISYSKQVTSPISESERFVEMDIVQDADRIEAIGAVGVARMFACGAAMRRPLSATRAHYNDKLVKLVPLMCTPSGKVLATKRAETMKNFFAAYDDEMNWATQTFTKM